MEDQKNFTFAVGVFADELKSHTVVAMFKQKRRKIDVNDLRYNGPLIVVGVLCNIFVLWIWSSVRSLHRRTSPTIYFFKALAVSDLFYQLLIVPTLYQRGYWNYILAHFLRLLCYGHRLLGIHITLLLAVTRFIMIFCPLSAQRLLAPRRLKLALGVVTVFCLSLQTVQVGRVILVPKKYFHYFGPTRSFVGKILPGVLQNLLMGAVAWRVYTFSRTTRLTMETSRTTTSGQGLTAATAVRESGGLGTAGQWGVNSATIASIPTALESTERPRVLPTSEVSGCVDNEAVICLESNEQRHVLLTSEVRRCDDAEAVIGLESTEQRHVLLTSEVKRCADAEAVIIECGNESRADQADRTPGEPVHVPNLTTLGNGATRKEKQLNSSVNANPSYLKPSPPAHHKKQLNSSVNANPSHLKPSPPAHHKEQLNSSVNANHSHLKPSPPAHHRNLHWGSWQREETSMDLFSGHPTWLNGEESFSNAPQGKPPDAPPSGTQQASFDRGLVLTTLCICLMTLLAYPVCSVVSMVFYQTKVIHSQIPSKVCVAVSIFNSGVNLFFYLTIRSFQAAIVAKLVQNTDGRTSVTQED